MKLENICGFRTLDDYVKYKLDRYSKEEKNFSTLFEYMFSESENVMTEVSDGYRIRRVTYGDFKKNILLKAPSVEAALSDVPKGGMVGIYMDNSAEWIEIFWSLLMTGYSPLLMNMRLDDENIEKILSEHSVLAVISDGKIFSSKTVLSEEIKTCDTPYTPDGNFGKEVVFMSSGTTDKVKLCAYTAENFYYQICDSAVIIKESPDIQRHFEGEIKHLTLLPFYHVFGFIAVYLWFGFFSRSFVFLKDMNPSTLLNTVKKHKVTHIFAVPLVWDTIYKEAMRKISNKGERTYKKFRKALKISNSTGSFGKRFAKAMLGEVREGIFGDSICCMITGGSPVRREVLEFFNGIGYHLANGYGMTEIGITSVEVSTKQKILNTGSIGNPFGHTEYSLAENGELLVRGKTKASRIIIGEDSTVTNPDEWFRTNDLAKEADGRYYLEGRIDDLIICENGENLNPVLAEAKLKVAGCDRICLFADKNGAPTLIASSPGCLSTEKLSELMSSLEAAVRDARLEGVIKKINVTTDPLIIGSEFKVSRRRVADRYENGKIRTINAENIDSQLKEILSSLDSDVRECFAEALEKSADEIGLTDNFFTVLGGTSLDYFTLISIVKGRFNIEFPADEGNRLTTVKEFSSYIRKN